MWVDRKFFDLVLADNKRQAEDIVALNRQVAGQQTLLVETRAQKAKDDITIDWMRHRVNALEKQNSILVSKCAGVNFPVPEIVPTRPGSMTIPDFSTMPTFEDVGDAEAQRLGIAHDPEGALVYAK